MATDIIVKLSINVTSEVHATLRFVNVSAAEAYLYKPFAFAGGRVRNNLFTIEGEGQKLRYKGPLAKRREPVLEDFLKLAPSSEHVSTVRLDDIYGFLPGEHRYQIRYSALNPRPDHSGLMEVTSDTQSFTFRASATADKTQSSSSSH